MALLLMAAPQSSGARTALLGRAAAGQHLSDSITGLNIEVTPAGRYTISSSDPSWTFGGTTAQHLSVQAPVSGADGIGPYREIPFTFAAEVGRTARIRLYLGRPLVLFMLTNQRKMANAVAFPDLSTYPRLPYRLTYQGAWITRTLSLGSAPLVGSDSPVVMFDSRANSYILSPASDFMVARTSLNGHALSSGIDPFITQLPAGLTHLTMLVLGHGINASIDTWGSALTNLYHKVRPANDADIGLKSLGYWTDNLTPYYYTSTGNIKDPQPLKFTDTLLALRREFQRKGMPLGYMQLDSWWYPKGPHGDWSFSGVFHHQGEYLYDAAPAVFPNGLAALQAQLQLPLITHARWVDAKSPYFTVQHFAKSGNVSTDPRFWSTILDPLARAGVVTYEQDWLADPTGATAAYTSGAETIRDQQAFMDEMAAAAARNGLSLQYCMPAARHVLQSVMYPNALTIRVSPDGFKSARWDQALYGFRLVSAVGLWPFTDAVGSNSTDNLLMATLSAGMVGVGDALGQVNATNLRWAVRADGVIVKPDHPLVPLDSVYLSDAHDLVVDGSKEPKHPMVAAAFTNHDGMKAAYVFAYSRPDVSITEALTITPSDLGFKGPVYIYDVGSGRGVAQDAGTVYAAPISHRVTGAIHHGLFLTIVPIGASGVAFLGDEGKFVALGRQRVAQLSDDGTVHARLVFAAGESTVVVHGYSSQRPRVRAQTGGAGRLQYDSATGLFRVPVSPDAHGIADVLINHAVQP
jgi:hypothetical protein